MIGKNKKGHCRYGGENYNIPKNDKGISVLLPKSENMHTSIKEIEVYQLSFDWINISLNIN